MWLNRQPLLNLRVLGADIAVYPPGGRFGPRKMVDYEFVWIIKGGGVVHYDEHKIAARPGTILLARPGMIDRYDWGTKERTFQAFIHFDLELPPKGWPSPESWPLWQKMPADDILRPLFRYVLKIDPIPKVRRAKLMLVAVGLMLQSYVWKELTMLPEPCGEVPPPVERAFQVISQIVAQEPSPSITLPELARAAGVSHAYLCVIFRKAINMSPMECLTLARLHRAAALLARSNLAIKQVAESTGFSSAYHFSRAFQNTFHRSPRAYRNAVHKDYTKVSNPIIQFLHPGLLSKLS